MPQKRKHLIIISVLSLLLITLLHPSVTAESIYNEEIVLLASSDSELVFELSVPWQSLQQTIIVMDERSFTYLTLPGYETLTQPGAPALPHKTFSLGAPFGADLIISVEVGKSHMIPLNAPILPSVTQERIEAIFPFEQEGLIEAPVEHTLAMDGSIYSGQAPFPEPLAEITNDDVLRQQRIVGVGVFPVQYDPRAEALIIYESVRVSISFDGDFLPARIASKADSPVYEAIFQDNLLNYEQALGWRQPFETVRSFNADEAHISTDAYLEAQPWQPPEPGWRIPIKDDGFYQLTYAALQVAGLPVDSLDPTTFQVFHLGEEVAIDVSGEDDLQFDPEDVIIFYGQTRDNKYAAETSYWLTHGGSPGKRIYSRDGAPLEAEIPNYHPAQLQMEENHLYRSLSPGMDDLDRFFWAYAYTYAPEKNTWIHDFNLMEPFEDTGTLKILLLGITQSAAVNPDHHAEISLNGQKVADVWWDGWTFSEAAAEIPAGLLLSGANEIKVYLPNDTGVGSDFVYIDWIELNFPSAFRVDPAENQLAFSFTENGLWQFELTGFATDTLAAYDVSDPQNVVAIDNLEIEASGSEFVARFEDEVLSPRDYWVGCTANVTSILASDIEADSPSNLQSGENSADYLVITHGEFRNEAQDLVNYRESQGWRTKLVAVQDIYDEFNYGDVSAFAIKHFIAHAYEHWQAPAPIYVVLVGDGHYDPKNYLGTSPPSYMPPYLTYSDPWDGEIAADNRYASFGGPGSLPNVMIGRLAVNSPAEARAFVDKIIAYEQTSANKDWIKQVLALAGATDTAGNFAQISDRLLNQNLPESYQAEKIYFTVTHTDAAEAAAAAKAGINSGKLIVNFIGHGYSQGWSSRKSPPEIFLRTADVPLLTNESRYPIVLAMTCNEGKFNHPTIQAMGEVITRAENKGAVASWSPTGQAVSNAHEYLNQGFYEAAFTAEVETVGEAVHAGLLKLWQSGGSLYMLDTYVLFGDPALVFPRFNKPPVAQNQSIGTEINTPVSITLVASDPDGDALSFSIVSPPEHGTFSGDAPELIYTSETGYEGEDSFTFKANDGEYDSNVATVTITISKRVHDLYLPLILHAP